MGYSWLAPIGHPCGFPGIATICVTFGLPCSWLLFARGLSRATPSAYTFVVIGLPFILPLRLPWRLPLRLPRRLPWPLLITGLPRGLPCVYVVASFLPTGLDVRSTIRCRSALLPRFVSSIRRRCFHKFITWGVQVKARNMYTPWEELKMMNKYQKASSAVQYAMNANAHVNPIRKATWME